MSSLLIYEGIIIPSMFQWAAIPAAFAGVRPDEHWFPGDAAQNLPVQHQCQLHTEAQRWAQTSFSNNVTLVLYAYLGDRKELHTKKLQTKNAYSNMTIVIQLHAHTKISHAEKNSHTKNSHVKKRPQQ